MNTPARHLIPLDAVFGVGCDLQSVGGEPRSVWINRWKRCARRRCLHNPCTVKTLRRRLSIRRAQVWEPCWAGGKWGEGRRRRVTPEARRSEANGRSARRPPPDRQHQRTAERPAASFFVDVETNRCSRSASARADGDRAGAISFAAWSIARARRSAIPRACCASNRGRIPSCLPGHRRIGARFSSVISPSLTSPPMAKVNSGDNPGYSRVHIGS